MKKFIFAILAALSIGSAFAQPIIQEATAAQVAAGTAGSGYYVSPRRQSGSVSLLYGGVQITYTGTFLSPFLLEKMPPTITIPLGVTSGATTNAVDGLGIYSVGYSEGAGSGPGISGGLLTVSFDNIMYLGSGGINLLTCQRLTSISFPALVSSYGSIPLNTFSSLTTFSLPLLGYIAGNFTPSTMGALTTLDTPSLVSVMGSYNPGVMALLTSLTAANLAYIGNGFNPNTMASLTALSFPSLKYIGGNCTVNIMASLTTVNFAAMVQYGAQVTMSASLGNLNSVTLGTIGTLKAINGTQVDVSGQKLPSANVNAILALLVSLDGTNGTTLWGSGKTLLINLGTNGAPTGQGITDKATLQGRGATITTN